MKRLFLVVVLLLACGPGQKPAVDVQPPAVTLVPGAAQPFAAAVAGAPIAVSWSVDCGAVTQAGLYTAPASPGTCHVTATAAPGVSGTATVTVELPPAVVTLSPAGPTAVDACRTLQLRASATRGSVAYAVAEEGGGAVDAAGLYAAPEVAGTYHVTATGSEGGTATATIVVQDHVLAVTVDPPTTQVEAGGQAQFTATVTTTCGTFPASSGG